MAARAEPTQHPAGPERRPTQYLLPETGAGRGIIGRFWDDAPDGAAHYFLLSAVFWFLVPGLVGLALAAFLYDPALQDLVPIGLRGPTTFGRLRPMHVNVAIFGWISMAWVGSMLYVTPRLTAAPLYSERLARAMLVLWNLAILGAAITLPLGLTQGREYAEMIWPLDVLMIVLFVMLAINIWGTVARRRERKLYVSIWNFMAASAIAPLVYAVGNKVWDPPAGAYTGMTDAIVNYFYVHNIFNVWFTTSALGLALYLLPRLSGKPLYSHRLAIWGFTSVWTGQHHLLYGPGPDWLEILSVSFSILAAIPNTAFLVNFVKTMEGRWEVARRSIALRWFVVGVALYCFTCFQGISMSFRSFDFLVHFTNYVVSHSHLAFFGAYTSWGMALLYTILPRIRGARVMAQRRVYLAAEWHFWLTLVGISVFMIDLWIGGWIQGFMWTSTSAPFIDSVLMMHGFMLVRLLAGIGIAVGQIFLIWALYQIERQPRAEPDAVANASAA